MKRQALGEWGERLAESHLLSKGYAILARNWRVQEGEVDLVAQDGQTIVFAEIKTRRSRSYGEPEQSITASKRRRLRQASWAYLEAHGLLEAAWRIDVIAIRTDLPGKAWHLEHYVNAVEAEEES
jgi:putative endonuclease